MELKTHITTLQLQMSLGAWIDLMPLLKIKPLLPIGMTNTL